MKSSFAWLVVPLLMTSLFAQTATPRSKTKKAPAKPAVPAVTAADVQALKDAIAAQQQQIQQLQQSLTQRDQAVEAAQQAAQQAQTAASDASQKAAAAQSASADKGSVDKLNSDLTDVKTTMQNQLLTVRTSRREFRLWRVRSDASAGTGMFESAARVSSKKEWRTAIAPAFGFVLDLTAS